MNLVAGVLGVGMFAAFVGFLAWRIAEPALAVIVGVALLMALVDLVQEVRRGA